MDALLSLNSSAQKREPYYKNFSDLPLGSYTVKKFHLKDSDFGMKLLVEVEDFYLTLPKRFRDKITTEAQVEEINRSRWRITFGGRDPGNFSRFKIDFKIIVEQNAQQLVVSDDDEEPEVIQPPEEDEVEIPRAAKRQADVIKNVYPSKRNRL